MLLLALLAGPDLAASATREVARQECRQRDGGDAITVCGRREQRNFYQVTDPAAPYDPKGNVKGVMTERMGWISEGDSGIGSCSNIGPFAGTGCFEKAWRRTLQQKGWLVR
ncbi:hypothetical protein [Sphingomonas sp. LHG3406-1]|uniref:hypothetical protein n=1 Tax=Sphingomonas sp. LHG3406-1 TaxID=2804617 RepID=UPI00262A8DD8|nr:hypothetical protein [Sphingomonas sp. LHG3406-1]